MAVSVRPAASNDNDPVTTSRRVQAKARPVQDDDFVELSDLSVALVGVVFWAFVGMLAGAWLHV